MVRLPVRQISAMGALLVAADLGEHRLGEALRSLGVAHVDPRRTNGDAGLAPLGRGADVDQGEVAGLGLVVGLRGGEAWGRPRTGRR